MEKTVETGSKAAALGVTEACRYLGGVGRSTLYRLPISHVKVAKRRVYLVTDLDKYLQAQRVES